MDETNWKQKYLDNLDQQENQEKQWQTTEGLLRQGLTRVALAAQGLDAQLDKDLDLLRKVIRKNLDVTKLESVVESLSTSVTRLDELRTGKSKTTSPQELLSHWLDNVSFPADQKKRAKDLSHAINETTDIPQMEAPLRELAELINQALQHESTENGDESGGFLHRLFSSDSTQQKNQPGHTSSETTPPQLGDFCIQLLDTLSLPAELTDQVETLKEKLANGLSDQSIAPALTAIANLISAMRRQMEEENKELQDFLRQLTGNLQELDQQLEGAQTHTRESITSGRQLDAVVQEHVKHIETTVGENADPEQLKQQIQLRLNAIRDHLEQYRNSEETRQSKLENQLEKLTSKIHNMESEGEQLRERLHEKHEQAVRDPLTGLHNRLAYDEHVIQEYARWKRYGQSLVLMMIDVDHFKLINDNYGHKAGDKALILIAEQLKSNLRTTDFLARFGGEEFVVLMPETDLDAAMNAAEKLRKAVEQCQFHYQSKQVGITVSAGLAQLRKDDSTDSVFQRADQAMYRAKAAGRNQCKVESD